MGLEKFNIGYVDYYDWIFDLIAELSISSTPRLEVGVLRSGKIAIFCNPWSSGNIILSLWIIPMVSGKFVRLGQLGTCCIEECSEEKLQQNLLPLFSRLCFCAFLGFTHEDILELGLEKSDIWAGTIEAPRFRRAFNTLFSAACYVHLVRQIKQCGGDETELKKLGEEAAKETLRIIGVDATDSLMKYLATKITEICLRDKSGCVDSFQMSYSSSLERYWTIRSYCPRLSMPTTIQHKQEKRDLRLALSYHMLQCKFHFRHEVKFYSDWIDVELKLDNFCCGASKMNSPEPIPSKVGKEGYIPAKIAVRTGPEYKSGVHAVSLGASSQNPSLNISKSKTVEKSFQAEQGMTNKINVGLKNSRTTGYSYELNNWLFEQSEANSSEGRLEWTLRDNYSGIPVFSYKPPEFDFWNSKTWAKDPHYNAFRALAQGPGSVRPFTQDGEVVFAKDIYGVPITWRLSRDLAGQTLMWFVEAEIWLAYYPNQYRTRYMEIRHHKFREVVQLSLVQAVASNLGNL